MKFKWALTVAGVALLVVAIVAAWFDGEAQDHAKVEAGARLASVRDSAAAEIVRAVTEADRSLATWTGGPPPAGLARAFDGWGEEQIEERIGGVPVAFTRVGDLDVFHEDAPGVNRRKGRIAAAGLRERLAGASDIGPPGARWTNIALVDRRGSPVLVLPGPRDDEDAERPEWERLRHSGALSRIAEAKAGELDPLGKPPAYKGADDQRAFGVWGSVGEGTHLRVLVEVHEASAMEGLPGWSIGFDHKEIVRLKPWHGAVALSMLILLCTLFLWVAGRYTEVGPLMRVYAYAKPYIFGIAVTVGAGLLFSVAKTSQVLLLKKLGDDVLVKQGDGARADLVWIVIATASLGLVMAVSTFFKDFLQKFYSLAMTNDIRLSIARRLVVLPMSFFHKMRTGDLNARIERDVAGMRILLDEVFEQGFVQPFVLVGALVTAFVMNPRLALILVGLPILVVPVFRIARNIKKRAHKRQVLIAEISHVIFQILSGMKVVKAFGGERREVERLAEANRKYIREARKIQRLSAFSKGLMDLLQMAGGALLVWFGGLGVLEGNVSLGDLMAFITVVQQIYVATKELTSTFNKVIEGTPAVMRVFEVIDAPDTLTDGPRELAKAPLRDGIELRDVRFQYLENNVLSDVSLKIPAGKVVALVGPTGAGKTTLCDLVARFYDATSGSVTYDGVNVREFTKASLMCSVAIVTQDAFLFNTTVEENIRYGRPGATPA
ncbi:MAG: ABC transporter ATP-binding protein/permease, partial [Planctomycetes bacterium]|nr:ABC transporter ATP-binding protein/permease [Planctomycetota bacterium]